MENLKYCPNCNSKIKKGLLGNNELYSARDMEFVNAFCSEEQLQLCFSCGAPSLHEARKNLRYERKKIQRMKEELISHLPIVSIEQPLGWEYETIGLVSERLKITIKLDGSPDISEEKCFNKIKLEAFSMGGNAVIGANIHYATYANMYYLLVNVFGTAVKVKNVNVLPKDYFESLENLDAYQSMIDLVDSFDHIKIF